MPTTSAAPAPLPGSTWVPVPSPVALEQNATYACALRLSSMERLVASPGLIAQKFQAAGFVDVTVGQDKTTVQGRWPLASVTGAPMPSQVVAIWKLTPTAAPAADSTDDVDDSEA